MASLQNKHIAVLAADGFEKAEVAAPRAALRSAGAQVSVVSLRSGRIRGMNLHEPATRLRVDYTLEETHPEQFDALFIPGGFISPDLLRQSALARNFVARFNALGKPIASICHGPWVLASAELVINRTLTSWPGIRDDLVHAGATWLDEAVVRDRNWLTSRGPQDLQVFVPTLVQFFRESAPVDAPRNEATQSAPQRNEPPSAVLKVFKWAPRPSLRTAIGLAAVGGAAWLARNRRQSTSDSTLPRAQ